MNRLWFHQIVLFPEPFSLHFPKPLKPQQPYSESTAADTNTTPSSSLFLSSSSLQEDFSNLSTSSPLTPPVTKNEEEEEEVEKRPRRGSLSSCRSRRSYSSSPRTQKREQRNIHKQFEGKPVVLQKSMSCRSLEDLELEEVKGFMDLGFIFKKEHLMNSRMITVVPGLLRLGIFRTKLQKTDEPNNILADDELPKDDDIEQEEEMVMKGVIRPYLSEAWLIKRPDSPLLNLRVPRVSAADDMKKHLKFWARTVASVVQQEC